MSNFIKSKTAKTVYFLFGLMIISAAMFLLMNNSKISASISAAKVIFEEEYHDFGKVAQGPQLEYTYNGITQQNRNVLLTRDPTVDGIKTGYTKNAGYCLIGTANRDNVRLVATVTGAENRSARANFVQSLLQFGYGFRQCEQFQH